MKKQYKNPTILVDTLLPGMMMMVSMSGGGGEVPVYIPGAGPGSGEVG